jgi:leader peptidase (prepilin peptidase)/N-methyltransferase
MTATDTVLTVAAGLLGAIVGSFLNVVIHRLPRGTFFSGGMRSVCANPECRRPIPWFLNIPVLGWLSLRGKARCCGQRISVRYPIVEALTAALFLLLWVLPPLRPAVEAGVIDAAGCLSFAFYAFFVANLIANSFIDIEHRILPDVLTKSAMAAGLLGSVLVPGLAGRFHMVGVGPGADSLLFSAFGLIVGLAVTQGIRKTAQALFRKEAMGFGDVKLMGAVGSFLGWRGVLLTLFAGSLLGAIVGIVYRWRTRDSYICFGPFLAAGALIVLFAGDRVFDAFAALERWQQANDSAPWVLAVGAIVSAVFLVALVRRGRAS